MEYRSINNDRYQALIEPYRGGYQLTVVFKKDKIELVKPNHDNPLTKKEVDEILNQIK